MSFKIGQAAWLGELQEHLDEFLTKGHSLAIDYDGLGPLGDTKGEVVNLIGTGTSVLETVTVTFTSGTAYSVVGSVSGALGTGSVGNAFHGSVVEFVISPGVTPFSGGDVIKFVMTRPWERLRKANIKGPNWDAGVDFALAFTEGDEYWYKAPGNTDEDEIFIGMQRFANNIGDYDNLYVMGAVGFESEFTHESQPNCRGAYVPALRIGAMPYWFFADGERVMVFIRNTSVYTGLYAGFIKRYWPKEQYPYPLAIGGSMRFTTNPAANSANWRFSNTSINHHLFGQTPASTLGLQSSCMLRDPIGRWIPVGTSINSGTLSSSDSYSNFPLTGIGNVFPWGGGGRFTAIYRNLDNSYALFPTSISEVFAEMTILDTSSWSMDNLRNRLYGLYRGMQQGMWQLGEFSGMFAITGYENGSENIINLGKRRYVVIQNAHRTTPDAYRAIELA